MVRERCLDEDGQDSDVDVVLDDDMPPPDFHEFVKKASTAHLLGVSIKAKSDSALGMIPQTTEDENLDLIGATFANEDGSSAYSSSPTDSSSESDSSF